MKMTAREYLVSTAKELMNTKDIDRISVQEILDISGVSRTTFYKHFRDKQDLVEQIFLSEISALFFYDNSKSLYERELGILKGLDANRTFFRNALRSDEFLRAWKNEALKSNIYNVKVLAQEKQLDEQTALLCAKIMTYVFADATIDWVLERPAMTAEAYARTLESFFWRGFQGVLDNQ